MTRIVVKIGGAVAGEAARPALRPSTRCASSTAPDRRSRRRWSARAPRRVRRRSARHEPPALEVVRRSLARSTPGSAGARPARPRPLGDEIGLAAGRCRARARRRPDPEPAAAVEPRSPRAACPSSHRRPGATQRQRGRGGRRPRGRARGGAHPLRHRRPGPAPRRRVAPVGADEAERLLDTGELEGGIVPKLRAAVIAARLGYRSRSARRRSSRERRRHARAPPHLRAAGRDLRLAARARGSWTRGRRYLDFLAGIAVVGLGHCHAAPLAAAHAQLDGSGTSRTSTGRSRCRSSPRGCRLASAARRRSSATRAQRRRGGVEVRARDRKAGRRRARGLVPRPDVGALSVTGQPAKRAPFEPLLADVASSR